MTTSHHVFAATPQFDSGRWKLRLEFVPLDIAKHWMPSTSLDSRAPLGIESVSVSVRHDKEVTR
jgi:hypothetical protein